MTRIKSVLIILFASLLATTMLSASGPPIVVEGMNDMAVDRSAIQDAVDAAHPGGRIVLRGIFQLDGIPIFLTTGPLTIQGQALDDDNDGTVNEDWSDGQDNDGDGRIDEDGWNTSIVGLADAGGGPAPDLAVDTEFNRSFLLRGVADDIRGIRIRDIRFSTLWRAMTFAPDIETGGGVACAGRSNTGGSLRDLRIEGSYFDNNDRAVEVAGDTIGVQVRDNRFSDTSLPLLILGDAVGCTEDDGSTGSTPIGIPLGLSIRSNQIAGASSGATVLNASAIFFLNNEIEALSAGIIVDTAHGVVAHNNHVIGASLSINLSAVSGRSLVSNNLLDAGYIVGTFLDAATTGVRLTSNTFGGGLFADIFLDETTSENRVRVGADTVVIDLGTDNDIQIEP